MRPASLTFLPIGAQDFHKDLSVRHDEAARCRLMEHRRRTWARFCSIAGGCSMRNAAHVCDVVDAVQKLGTRQGHGLCKLRVGRLISRVLHARPHAARLSRNGAVHDAALQSRSG